MPTDQVILAKDVLDAVMRVRRISNTALMEELEQREPDLAELVMEEHSAIYAALVDSGVSAKATRRISRQVQSLVLTVAIAARQGYRRLWDAKEEDAGSEERHVPPEGGSSSAEFKSPND